MKKTTETWGERMAEEAKRLVARRRPDVRSLEWLAPIVRRATTVPSPATRFARIDPTVKSVEEDDGFPLPADVRERLRDAIGGDVGRTRVHTGEAADAVARTHHADAVTIGDHVMFRRGQFRPHEERGLALLAHEVTHVVEGASPTVQDRRTLAGVHAEEARAHANEARIVAPLGSPPVPLASPAVPSLRTTSVASGAPATRPMAADIDRAPAAAPAAPSFDVAELKRSIYRELLQKIRSDAERGG